MLEEWRPVVGYEGSYEISSHGRVKSLCRDVLMKDGRYKHVTQRIIASHLSWKGYRVVKLYEGCKRKQKYIHRLVAESFIGGLGETVNHKDGNKVNNRPENLEWMSCADNNRHAVDIGLHSLRIPVIGVGPDGDGIYLVGMTVGHRFGFKNGNISRAVRTGGLHKGWAWYSANELLA